MTHEPTRNHAKTLLQGCSHLQPPTYFSPPAKHVRESEKPSHVTNARRRLSRAVSDEPPPMAGSHHAGSRIRFPFFRVFYSTTYTVILILTICLLLVSPGDGIYQSYRKRQLWNVVIIAATYILTALVALFIYATRLYTTRQHLAGIPRYYLPVRKGDVSTAVRKLIEDGLARSAAVAYNAHPRLLHEDENPTPAEAEVLGGGSGQGVVIKSLGNEPGNAPPWGVVAHPGWSSPASADLPNVHYEPVLLELPHLIEAKAVSFAPPDPLADDPSAAPHPQQQQQQQDTTFTTVVLPDPAAVSVLQRFAGVTLRDYLAHLSSLAMLPDPDLQDDLVRRYEYARFSTQPLAEPEFRALVTVFSDVLRSMLPPDPALLAEAQGESASSSIRSISSAAVSRPASIRTYSQASLIVDQLENGKKRYHQGSSGSAAAAAAAATAAATPSLPAHTPFFTPYQPYPGSLSSNDGDHDDSGSEHTTQQQTQRSAPRGSGGRWGSQTTNRWQRSASRYTSGSGARRTPAPRSRSGSSRGSKGSDGWKGREGEGAEGNSDDDDAGSVIKHVPTNTTEDSSLGHGSVVINRDASEVLNLPIAMDEDGETTGTGLGIT